MEGRPNDFTVNIERLLADGWVTQDNDLEEVIRTPEVGLGARIREQERAKAAAAAAAAEEAESVGRAAGGLMARQ